MPNQQALRKASGLTFTKNHSLSGNDESGPCCRESPLIHTDSREVPSSPRHTPPSVQPDRMHMPAHRQPALSLQSQEQLPCPSY